MRSLFGCTPGRAQLSFDYSALEARIQGSYCWNYTDGEKLAEELLRPKPADIHQIRANSLDIARDQAKSVNYMLLYGGQVGKIMKMLGCNKERATEIYNGFWDGSPALKELKAEVEEEWERNGKKYVTGIDGRKILTRSKHSLLNALFQSAGVICAKYVTVALTQKIEAMGYNMDPFKGIPDVAQLIEYHDEQALEVDPKLLSFFRFETEQQAKDFKKSWTGSQLSAISESHKGGFYICKPNFISKALEESVLEVESMFKLNVNLGFEWVVGRNWKDCH